MSERKWILVGLLIIVASATVFEIYCHASFVEEPSLEVVTDRDYFPAIRPILQNATKSIHVAMFSMGYYPWEPTSNENLLLNELIRADARGVDVKVILDEYPEGNDKTLEYLTVNGVDAQFDSPEVCTHAKLIIVDSETVIVGSTNWRYYSLEENHEANVLIQSEEVAKEFEQYFEGLWS